MILEKTNNQPLFYPLINALWAGVATQMLTSQNPQCVLKTAAALGCVARLSDPCLAAGSSICWRQPLMNPELHTDTHKGSFFLSLSFTAGQECCRPGEQVMQSDRTATTDQGIWQQIQSLLIISSYIIAQKVLYISGKLYSHTCSTLTQADTI